MAQAPPPAHVGLLPLTLALLLAVATGVLAQAQTIPPYLLLQGPSAKKSQRYLLGERIVVRFRGEDEFFPLTIKALYPDARAVLLGENLIQLADIAAVRHPNRPGIKRYLQIQGLVNIVATGLAALADREVRERQTGFALGAVVVSGAMVTYGSVDRYRTRLVGTGKSYVLAIGGGVEPEEARRDEARRF